MKTPIAAQALLKAYRKLPTPILVGLVVVVVSLGLAQTHLWRQIERGFLDALIVGSAPNSISLPVTLIGIDDATLAEFGVKGELPREAHARLLDRLREAEVAVVGFDLPMAAITPEDDALFAAAIKSFGRVVLASDMSFSESGAARQWTRVEPDGRFIEAGAKAGFVPLSPDDDDVLRRMPADRDAFAYQIVRVFDAHRASIVEFREPRKDTLIRFVGGPRSFTYIPFQDFLDPGKRISPKWQALLRDNIVIVGRNFHTGAEAGSSRADAIKTAFFGENLEFTPRIEAQANIVASMVLGSALSEASRLWGGLLAVIGGVLSVICLLRFPRRQAALAVAGASLALFGLQYFFYYGVAVWLPTVMAALVPLTILVCLGFVFYFFDRRVRGQVQILFGNRLPPSIRSRVVSDTTRLRTLAERREVTCLVSRLWGLSAAGSQLSAELAGEISGRHYAAVAAAVFAQDGVLQCSEGDRVIAFWGAPYDDERQRLHAVLATNVLRDAMTALCAELSARHGMSFRVQIGVAQGDCCAGNFSGALDFQYGVFGEAMDTARFLESLCAAYGVDNLIQGRVAAPLQKRVTLQPVDTVQWSETGDNLELYSCSHDADRVETAAAALAAYRGGDFSGAAAQWKAILGRHPEDRTAQVFVARCERMANNPSGPGWNGVTRIPEFSEFH